MNWSRAYPESKFLFRSQASMLRAEVFFLVCLQLQFVAECRFRQISDCQKERQNCNTFAERFSENICCFPFKYLYQKKSNLQNKTPLAETIAETSMPNHTCNHGENLKPRMGTQTSDLCRANPESMHFFPQSNICGLRK